MSEAIRRLKADAKRDLSENRVSRFCTGALALMVVASLLLSLLGNVYAHTMLAIMAGGLSAALLVSLALYHSLLRKPAIAVSVASMPIWIILGLASLAPGLRWLEPAFGGVSEPGFTLAAAVQGAVMLCMIQGLLALFGKYRRV